LNKQSKTQTVLVTGDVTIDWNIARIQKTDVAVPDIWYMDIYSRAFCQVGGACLIADLIEEISKNLKNNSTLQFEIDRIRIPISKVRPDNTSLNHSYAVWSPYDYERSESGKKRKVWRVRDFLGVSRMQAEASNIVPVSRKENNNRNPSIILLDDAGLGFRNNEILWPKAMFSSPNTQIILKVASPITSSKLLDYLLDNYWQKLTVIMTANDLRQSHIHLSRGVSWERTAQDLLWEFSHNPTFIRLSRCTNVVISFNTAGAIFLSAAKSSPRRLKSEISSSLIYDPNTIEDNWGQEYQGGIVGLTSCLTAAITKQYMVHPEKPDISFAIQSGITAMRLLKKEGYGDVNFTNQVDAGPAFPISKIAAKLEESVDPLAVARIADPDIGLKNSRFWTILEDRYKDEMEQVAKDIVWKGFEKVISSVPVCRFGELVSIDRREIEALNNVHNIIREYYQGNLAKPISLAVFGTPGSGKSFSITQIAKGIAQDQLTPITFNLSQFTNIEDLINAFHQVRDISLKGKLPLVFWDEFDTTISGQLLGWLRYFLAPMQDGVFQDGQVTHPIGRGIFVFAGGTCLSMEDFESKQTEISKDVKLTDFISRLRGFLNVIGINPQGDNDKSYILRRAITFRNILERTAKQIFVSDKRAEIDESVIDAFLFTEQYKHGIRSMESMVALSQLSNKVSFEKSFLPNETQLALHVNAIDFIAILQKMVLDPITIERMAEVAHEIYRQTLKNEGYTLGPADDNAKTSDALVSYPELRDELKEQNRELVRDIPHKLDLTRYVMLPSSSGKKKNKFTNEEIEYLGEKEHERWEREKWAKGYTLGEDRARMQNPFLLKWSDLPDDIKERDRRFIRGIPKILAKNGYLMVKKTDKPIKQNRQKAISQKNKHNVGKK
jgi:hypothetical protein